MKKTRYDQCPCWALDGNRCSLTEGGVYIPLPHHILMFCNTPSYTLCTQYIRGRELIMHNDAVERRRMRRYNKKVNIDIIVCDTRKSPPLRIKHKTSTLDVSLCGMKIESPEELTLDSVVGFEVDHSHCSDILIGAGSVRWCERLSDPDKYEFGIAFSEDTLTREGIEKLLCM